MSGGPVSNQPPDRQGDQNHLTSCRLPLLIMLAHQLVQHLPAGAGRSPAGSCLAGTMQWHTARFDQHKQYKQYRYNAFRGSGSFGHIQMPGFNVVSCLTIHAMFHVCPVVLESALSLFIHVEPALPQTQPLHSRALHARLPSVNSPLHLKQNTETASAAWSTAPPSHQRPNIVHAHCPVQTHHAKDRRQLNPQEVNAKKGSSIRT